MIDTGNYYKFSKEPDKHVRLTLQQSEIRIKLQGYQTVQIQ